MGEPLWGEIVGSSTELVREHGAYRAQDGFALRTTRSFQEGQPLEVVIQRRLTRRPADLRVVLGGKQLTGSDEKGETVIRRLRRGEGFEVSGSGGVELHIHR